MQALLHYKKVAKKDCAMGQFNLGWFYETGKIVNKILKMAVYFYEKAANNGHLMAMHNLGLLYIRGGDNKDYRKAFELCKRSAE
ncbi:uncharacterized protein OCT59_024034 [Rhizophagus irregularis]|nr:hypothetical protein RirG_153920 [Rhizophagus irregularis DAOM 197198w]UZO03630.1 hypothetical protein OCT59_024034 [Rhizophagus irregularis]GBC22170.1 kinase-like domain-containing protein [Rhizophagus irregularis DAOM 181602=DAOM 197198]